MLWNIALVMLALQHGEKFIGKEQRMICWFCMEHNRELICYGRSSSIVSMVYENESAEQLCFYVLLSCRAYNTFIIW